MPNPLAFSRLPVAVQGQSLGLMEVSSDLMADDSSAVSIFLDSYSFKSPHTLRAYTKECWRFLLWVSCRKSPRPDVLPLVSVEDANDYIRFLRSPSPFPAEVLEAAGFRCQPFRKALATESINHAVIILNTLFEFLGNLRAAGNMPYCMFNPFKAAHRGVTGLGSAEEVEHVLTHSQWETVLQAIDALPRESERDLKHYHRARWVMHLLYRTYLRRSEAANLTMGSFFHIRKGWKIRVLGKGAKTRDIIATRALMDELRLYRESLGLTPLPSPGETLPAIMAVTGKNKGVTDQAIYLITKVIFQRAADLVRASDKAAAEQLEHASTHWMRHTGITHDLEAGAEVRYVQAQARHASPKTTARYDHKQEERWRNELEEAQTTR